MIYSFRSKKYESRTGCDILGRGTSSTILVFLWDGENTPIQIHCIVSNLLIGCLFLRWREYWFDWMGHGKLEKQQRYAWQKRDKRTRRNIGRIAGCSSENL